MGRAELCIGANRAPLQHGEGSPAAGGRCFSEEGALSTVSGWPTCRNSANLKGPPAQGRGLLRILLFAECALNSVRRAVSQEVSVVEGCICSTMSYVKAP